MIFCNGKDAKCLCDQVKCEVAETQEGVQISLSAKDPAKSGQFKALLKSLHSFCGCECC